MSGYGSNTGIHDSALLRAAAHGSLRILFPFVSSAQEIRAARAMLGEARAELQARGISAGSAAVGIMIEAPSAAFTASLLAREDDFFTIGTNDLIQYTLAVDRTDERVSDRYQPLHPAVLRLLVGCGLTELSMTPGALPMARRVVQETSAGEMGRIAARVLTSGSVDEIEQFRLDSCGRPAMFTEVNTQ